MQLDNIIDDQRPVFFICWKDIYTMGSSNDIYEWVEGITRTHTYPNY